ncbi:MAG: phosphatase PAP2 family protein [Polyangiaceae bacterium]|nr:phosphatase PAP2 family protein [Polyangiaceae bacterium]
MATHINSEPTTAPNALAWSRLARALGPQDWIASGYLLAMSLAAITAADHPSRTRCIVQMSGLWLVCSGVTFLVRSRIWQQPVLAPLVYRLTLFGSIVTSYLFLDHFLPLVNPRVLDAELHALDLAVFGFEPAVLLDHYVTPFWTEWFSFFYFSYFYLSGAHIFPILLFTRDERLLCEFSLGMLLLYVIGQTLYLCVPGFGPLVALAGQFTHALPHGFWLDTVMTTVHSGGAQKDIFPSLHTATPTFLTLLSFRHRHRRPFRYTWPLVGFFAINIIIATMYLRWHWLIDVVAGVLLAIASLATSAWVTRHELARRKRDGLGNTWCELQLLKPRS